MSETIANTKIEDLTTIKNQIVGKSLQNLKELVINLARMEENVLILGQSGTGKELFARLYSAALKTTLTAVNCAGMSDSLLHSELFGHERGAFTGATKSREGIVGGNPESVIFLDEIGDSSELFQASMLRFLETGDYRRVGSDEIQNAGEKKVKFRIIAATTKGNSIRPELKFRFQIISLPELYNKYRKNDIPELIRHICSNFTIKFMTKKALEYLLNIDYDGNVRELRAILNQGVFLCHQRGGETICRCDVCHWDDVADNKDATDLIAISELQAMGKIPSSKSYIGTWGGRKEERKEEEETNCAEPPDNRVPPAPERIASSLNAISHHLAKMAPKSEEVSVDQPHFPSFENTSPKRYRYLFWDYHAKKGRGGRQVSKLFGGKIKEQNAYAQLTQIKKRLEKKNSK